MGVKKNKKNSRKSAKKTPKKPAVERRSQCC